MGQSNSSLSAMFTHHHVNDCPLDHILHLLIVTLPHSGALPTAAVQTDLVRQNLLDSNGDISQQV